LSRFARFRIENEHPRPVFSIWTVVVASRQALRQTDGLRLPDLNTLAVMMGM